MIILRDLDNFLNPNLNPNCNVSFAIKGNIHWFWRLGPEHLWGQLFSLLQALKVNFMRTAWESPVGDHPKRVHNKDTYLEGCC